MLITVPLRRHKCEVCGSIFDCLECLEAMLENNQRDTWNASLYSKDHEPVHGNRDTPNKPWLCERCVE